MKAMPLSFEECQGKGFPLVDFTSSLSSSDSPLSALLLTPTGLTPPNKWRHHQKHESTICYVGSSSEPTSVLDTRRSPSPPTSSSTTLSSSFNGGAAAGGPASADAVAASVSDVNPPILTHQPEDTEDEVVEDEEEEEEDLVIPKHQKCGLGIMEDWESLLSEPSPAQEQSILRLIMADVDDPSLGLNKLLQSGVGGGVNEFTAGFGPIVDHHQQVSYGGGFEVIDHSSSYPPLFGSNNNSFIGNSALFDSNNTMPVSFSPFVLQQQQQHQLFDNVDAKPHIFGSQMVMNQNQAQLVPNSNQGFVVPLTYAQVQQHRHIDHHQSQVASPPPVKRLNTGGGAVAVGPNFHVQKANNLFAPQQEHQNQLQLLSHSHVHHHMVQPKPFNNLAAKSDGGSTGDEQLAMVQKAITDQLSKAAELIETGSNPILAQGILARLNHQLTPLGNKPLQRASFYFKEALQLLINNNNNPMPMSFSPFNLIFKIGAYKAFSEISPVLQFANFTSNQAILEATDGFARIHVIDFDIAYGGQWASFMQEMALRNNNCATVSLKITAFASPSTHDEFELGFTQENLKHFAAELNLPFDLEILSLDALNSCASWPPTMNGEAVAVNLPIASFASNNPMSLPLALRFAKQLSPKILVTLEQGYDRTDASFPLLVTNGLNSFAALLESLDAVNASPDVSQKIERCLIQPSIEKMVLSGTRRSGSGGPGDRALHPWRGLAMSAGFSTLGFSNFAESQAECLVQRSPARGFHVEKRQASLVLCWQRKDLVTLSAWRC